ncbi:MAG: hypothetical protein ABEJ85_04970 [Haloarculaceae archaeon]
MAGDIMQRLEETPRSRRNIGPQEFDWSANSMSQRSRIARLRAEVAHKILGRESDKPLKVAIPAYENLGTTNGTADDTESYSVSHGIMDTPNTDPIVLWLDGEYYGQPDNSDYVSTDSVDVTDSGTGSTVHAFYVPEKAGTLEIEKATDGARSKQQNLKTVSLKNVHRRDLSESSMYFEFNEPGQTFEAFVAGEMTLDVYVTAPYVARYTDPDGDGAVATNALLNFSTLQAKETIPGFKQAVEGEM